jgi:molybdopterin-guanine dinucleotide biosynthesis protein A
LISLRRQPLPHPQREPLGVVLAGGLGHRIGGSKAIVELNRRPLISYPLESVWRALGNIAIVAKTDTELPSLPGVTVWVEPQEPRHPLTGIMHALAIAEGRPVLICAGDLPFVTAELIREIAHADPGSAPAVVARSGGQSQPLLACYQPRALELLSRTRSRAQPPLRESIAALDPAFYEVDDPDVLFNINSPDDLLQAAGMIDQKKAPSRR